MKESIKAFFTPELLEKLLTSAIGLVFFYVVYLVIKKLAKNIATKKLKPHTASLFIKTIKYVFYVLVIVYILGIFDINLTALFGAAGIAGIAVGFAAQTSISNIISGFFLLTDHAAKVGDFITIDGVSGTVASVDLISIKIKTPDNKMVRIPNETVIKTNLQNISFYPTRRLDVVISVSYDTDLRFALETLSTVPEKCPLVLKDPAPILFCTEFGSSGINITLGVWLNNDDLIAVRNQIFIAIKETFDAAKIEIPFPQVVIHSKA
ncbi:MAG: mechanosensitive ion channel family protein [Spirochaetaceae bacterium]|nr:mechanosensitive ion channel family protein [Spirochaetaceae bacterium]